MNPPTDSAPRSTFYSPLSTLSPLLLRPSLYRPSLRCVILRPDARRSTCNRSDRSGEGSQLKVTKAGDAMEIANAAFAIRVPAAQEKTLAEPAGADAVPAPLIAFRQTGSDWAGGSHFFTERKVAYYQFRLAEEGPASVVFEARYRFAPRGDYLMRIRVSDGLNYAVVTEEFDFGGMTEGHDFVLLGIGEKWQPAQATLLTSGGGDASTTQPQPLAEYLAKKAAAGPQAQNNVAPDAPPPFFKPGSDKLVFLERFTTTGAYGPLCGFGVAAAPRSVMVLPIQAGSWRRAMALMAWNDPDRGVQVALPITPAYLLLE